MICPVCNYLLGFHAWKNNLPSDEICPSCGIQFGYDDAKGNNEEERKNIHLEWRKKWVKSGKKWWSETKRPKEWNP
jgi:hypothetical protein